MNIEIYFERRFGILEMEEILLDGVVSSARMFG